MGLVKVAVLERGLQLGLDPQGARSTTAGGGHLSRIPLVYY